MPTIAEKWFQDGIEQGIENNMADADIRKITGCHLQKLCRSGKK